MIAELSRDRRLQLVVTHHYPHVLKIVASVYNICVVHRYKRRVWSQRVMSQFNDIFMAWESFGIIQINFHRMPYDVEIENDVKSLPFNFLYIYI